MNKNNKNTPYKLKMLAILIITVAISFGISAPISSAQAVATVTATTTAESGVGQSTSGQSAADYIRSKIEALKKQIEELTQELARLELNEDKDLDNKNFCHTFSTNLWFGNKGKDIPALHALLRAEGFEVPNEQGIFGEKTVIAVKLFQERYAKDILAQYGLTKGTGYVGLGTRAKMNTLYGCINPDNGGKITPKILPQGSVGSFYNQKMTVNFSTSSPVEWSISAGSLPDGLNISRGALCIDFVPPNAGVCLNNKESLIYGTPRKSGLYKFTLMAKSATEVAETRYEMDVTGAPSIGTIEVTSPNGDERWILNTTKSIKWDSNISSGGRENKVKISLVPYYPPCKSEICPLYPVEAPFVIVPSTQNDGSYDWTVGKFSYDSYDSMERRIAPPGQFTVLLCTIDGNVCDASDSPFLIIDVPPSSNRAPSINKVTAPTKLEVEEVGTWKIDATDPEGGSLTYSINWGDQASSRTPQGQTASYLVEQKSSFTHNYAKPGIYTVEITVSDSTGKTAKATANVIVSLTSYTTIDVGGATTTTPN